MKEYKNSEVVVYWYPELCAHPGTCLRLLPKVFDVNRRPWVDVNAAAPEDIIRTIDACPSGALRYALPQGSAVDPVTADGPGHIDYEKTHPPMVRFRFTGGRKPLYIEGPAELIGEDGKLIKAGSRLAVCTCGKSQNGHLCDGAHNNMECD